MSSGIHCVLIDCGPGEAPHPLMTWDDSCFKFVAIIYNGSKQNIIFNKVKFTVCTFFYFVNEDPEFSGHSLIGMRICHPLCNI